jgi:hypothetical protein
MLFYKIQIFVDFTKRASAFSAGSLTCHFDLRTCFLLYDTKHNGSLFICVKEKWHSVTANSIIQNGITVLTNKVFKL